MKIENEIIEGFFIRESKNRFLCEIRIGDRIHECYVPSSSRMENYLVLRNKQVLLSKNKVSGRTDYSLFAVKYYKKYVLLNLNLVSTILESGIIKEIFPRYGGYKVYKEYTIKGYKSDLTLINSDENTTDALIIEAKSIISIQRTAFFPKVHSERAIKQLIMIRDLLKKGLNVCYLFVSLSPFVRSIKIEESTNTFCLLLQECINEGLQIKAVSLKFEDGEISLNRNIKVVL